MAVEEQNRAERLVLCRRGDLSVDGQPRQQSRNRRRPQLTWMPKSVEPDVLTYPVQIGFFGPPAVVPCADLLAHTIKQSCCHPTTMPSSPDVRKERSRVATGGDRRALVARRPHQPFSGLFRQRHRGRWAVDVRFSASLRWPILTKTLNPRRTDTVRSRIAAPPIRLA